MKNKNPLTLNLAFWVLIFVAVVSSCHKTPKYNAPAPATGPKWVRINTLPADSITAVEVFNNVIYAASTTSGKIYESSDNGESWSSTNSIAPGVHISRLTVFNGRIFVGTFDGYMYSSGDNGKTWANEGGLTVAVTSFVTWNNNLYCSSFDNGGKGLLLFNSTNSKWEPFPTSDLGNIRVSKVIIANNHLAAATSDFFATFDPAQQLWHTNTYTDRQFPNYVVDMVDDQGIILTQIYVGNKDQQSIVRSDEQGTRFDLDTVGFKADADDEKYLIRGLLIGSNKIYSVINQNKGTVGAWIQHRDKGAVMGATWAKDEEFLPGLSAYALRQFNDGLFLATSKGLYFRKI